MEKNKPKSVKSKMNGRKIESGLIWQGALKQKGVKQTGVKRGIGVEFNLTVFCRSFPSHRSQLQRLSLRSQSRHFVPAANTTLKSTGERPTHELYTILLVDEILTLRKFNFPSNTVSTECENQIHHLLLICLSYKYIYVCVSVCVCKTNGNTFRKLLTSKRKKYTPTFPLITHKFHKIPLYMY